MQNRPKKDIAVPRARVPGEASRPSSSRSRERRAVRKHDDLVTEEPLELRLSEGAASQTVAVTMRTPGNDFELAAGFLYNESIVRSRDEIAELTYCLDSAVDPRSALQHRDDRAAARALPRRIASASCATSRSAALAASAAARSSIRCANWACDRSTMPCASPRNFLYELPERMREAQRIFASTGGLHAAALFDERGALLAVREDVGRHNAIDKIVGWGLLDGRLPFERCILLVSGRASYEVLQKSVMARIPIVCSVSAPSSLAVDLAREFDVTLVGFLRGNRANLYAGESRVE